jgi:hypothetical protein
MVKLLGTVGGDFVLYFFGNARGDLLEFFPYRLIDRGGVGRACRRRRCLGLLVFEALPEYQAGNSHATGVSCPYFLFGNIPQRIGRRIHIVVS